MPPTYRTTASFELYPQHCSLPEFTPAQHAEEVCTELVESIQQLSKKPKKKLIQWIADALQQLATERGPTKQRVAPAPTSEGGATIARVSNAPPITTTTNPTAPATHKAAKHTHFRLTCNNTPGTVPPIISQDIEETTNRRSPRL